MNPGAGVHSLEALNDWYSALVAFKSEAQNGLVSVAMSLQHLAAWLEEQLAAWKREIRRAEDAVITARTALRNKQYEDWSGSSPDTTVEEKNLRKALARQEFVEERHEVTRRWIQRLPKAIEDCYEGAARNMNLFLDSDLPRALADLKRQMAALEQYARQSSTITEVPQP